MVDTSDMARELDPGASYVVGRNELARRYKRGERWARNLLRKWWHEQQNGGPTRVYPRVTKLRNGKERVAYFTTVAVLLRDMPQGRDEPTWRKLKEHAEAIEWLTRRLNEETMARRALEARLAKIEGKLRLR